MKKLLSFLACLAMVIVGGVALVACGETAPNVTNVQELYEAINAQKDSDTIVLKEGTYDLDPQLSTLEYSGQTNWYLPILKNNVTIKGQGKVVLESSHETPNGAWATQNFITVIGDNFTLENVTIVCKKEVNKAVEVLGKDVTFKDVTFESPTDYDFAGSVYFNNVGIEDNEAGDVGTATFDNVKFNKGRITASGAKTGKFVFKNDVEITWVDIEPEILQAAGFYPLYKLNTNSNPDSTFQFDGLNNVTIKMNATEMGSAFNLAKAEIPEGVKVVNVAAEN